MSKVDHGLLPGFAVYYIDVNNVYIINYEQTNSLKLAIIIFPSRGPIVLALEPPGETPENDLFLGGPGVNDISVIRLVASGTNISSVLLGNDPNEVDGDFFRLDNFLLFFLNTFKIDQFCNNLYLLSFFNFFRYLQSTYWDSISRKCRTFLFRFTTIGRRCCSTLFLMFTRV